jgi:hypothetical protein
MVRRWLPAPVPKCSVMHVAMSPILRWDWLTIELTVSEFDAMESDEALGRQAPAVTAGGEVPFKPGHDGSGSCRMRSN